MTRFVLMLLAFPLSGCLLAGCGASSGNKSNPALEYDGMDYSGVDATGNQDVPADKDTSAKDQSGDAIPSDQVPMDGLLPDGASPDLADGNTSELPASCVPGEKYCDGLDIMRCNPDGLGYTLSKSCVDENPCTDDYCEDGKCLRETPDLTCCFPKCEMGQICMENECVCASMCLGRECGDDGCGGTCGECPAHHVCTDKGKCACIPQCDGKNCGDDDCGSTCGTCPEQNVCQEGVCLCIPNCDGKICGTDGCGGSCGECAALEECVDNACAFTCPTCPQLDGCTRFLNPANYHAYYLCGNSVKWDDAKDFCESKGTYLVRINNAEENAYVASLLAVGAVAWIGLAQDWGDWGKWKWAGAGEPDYTAWGPNQPDDGGVFSSEDCADTASWALWNDAECGNKSPFICELAP